MLDSKCTYSTNEEVEGNKQKKENIPGIVRSGIMQKVTSKGTFAMLFVQNIETGQLVEVFASSVKITS